MSEIVAIDGTEFVQTEVLPGMEEFVPEVVEVEISNWEEFLQVAAEDSNAYGIAKIANAVLQFMGVERVLPPQMFYNYSRKAMIAKRDKNEKGVNVQHQYSKDEVIAFLSKYIKKNIAK